MDNLGMPHRCGIMEYVSASDEARARTARASRNYVRLRDQFAEARKELAAAVVAERAEGEKIEDITERVPVRQATVNRFLVAAGVTEMRATPATGELPPDTPMPPGAIAAPDGQ